MEKYLIRNKNHKNGNGQKEKKRELIEFRNKKIKPFSKIKTKLQNVQRGYGLK